jgi:hypothetical protein
MTINSYFELGATAATRTNVEGQVDRQPSSCRFVRWPVRYTGLDGQEMGGGLPIAYWLWKLLTQAELNRLHDYFEVNGVFVPSVPVSIKTRDDRGVFVPYTTAIFHWPDDVDGQRDAPGIYRNVEFMFTRLTE